MWARLQQRDDRAYLEGFLTHLTQMEQRVLQARMDGIWPLRDIAERLGMDSKQVDNCCLRIYRKIRACAEADAAGLPRPKSHAGVGRPHKQAAALKGAD